MRALQWMLVIGALCANNVALAGVCDPMVVHAANDGGVVVLSSPANGVNFNMRGDGVVRTSWPTTANDAWLVLPDADGKVTSGAQMFGADSAKGADANAFVVLAQYDDPSNGGNGDGIISDQDTVYASLRLWADGNRNGVVDDGELSTLPDHGIHALVLTDWGSTRHDTAGNAYLSQAKIVGVDDIADKRFLQAVIPNVAGAPDGHTSATTCDGGGTTAPPPSPPPSQWHCSVSCDGRLTGTYSDGGIGFLQWMISVGQDSSHICGSNPVAFDFGVNGVYYATTWRWVGQSANVNQATAQSNAASSCLAIQQNYIFSYTDQYGYYTSTYPFRTDGLCWATNLQAPSCSNY